MSIVYASPSTTLRRRGRRRRGAPQVAVGPLGEALMRLWSLHPQYLDPKGLVALWREGLLAQAVLAGQTRGYKHHPQLARFLDASAPRKQMAAYLRLVHAEAARRGYRFDAKKIGRGGTVEPLAVTQGQLKYEWVHLTNKLKARAPSWLGQLAAVKLPEPHPLFRVIAGGIAAWEVVAAQQGAPAEVPSAASPRVFSASPETHHRLSPELRGGILQAPWLLEG